MSTHSIQTWSESAPIDTNAAGASTFSLEAALKPLVIHLPAWRRIDPVQVSILSLSAVLTQSQQWRPQLVLHFPFNKHPSGLILACGFTFGNVILH